MSRSRISRCVFCLSLFAISFSTLAQSKSDTDIVSDAKMRFVRLRSTIIDGTGNPIQNIQWNTQGSFRQVTSAPQYVSVRRYGEDDMMLAFKYLLIPDAPWMNWGNSGHIGICFVADSGSEATEVGDEEYVPIQIPGSGNMRLRMWYTTYNDRKNVGILDNKIFESVHQGDVGKQIGWLDRRKLTIETGETVFVFMTKGMEDNAKWEGDVGDTTYREEKEGQGTPISKLKFCTITGQIGKGSVVLVSRSIKDKGNWVGAIDGKVVSCE